MEWNKIYNMDCLEGMMMIPDRSVDLVVTDPPYEFVDSCGGGTFGNGRGKNLVEKGKGRMYHAQIEGIGNGFNRKIIEECARICKIPNMYFFCNKEQLPMYLNFAIEKKLHFDVLTWHKQNPIPMCSNKYLSDTEYVVFMRGVGAKVYGTFETKRKWWVTKKNIEDKKKWGHPTIKPLNIIQTLIINSSQEGGVILDPFMGSGTTAVAAIKEKRNYIGFEIEKKYYDICLKRIENEQIEQTLEL